MTNRYKGYIIDARSFECRDGLGWTSEFSVFDIHRPEPLDTMFYLRESFQDRDSALKAAFVVGMEKIDAGFKPLVVY